MKKSIFVTLTLLIIATSCFSQVEENREFLPLELATKHDSLFYRSLGRWSSYRIHYRGYPDKPLVSFVPDNIIIPDLLKNDLELTTIVLSERFIYGEVELYFCPQVDGSKFVIISNNDDIAPISAFYYKEDKKWEKIQIHTLIHEYGIREILGVLGDYSRIWVVVDVFREGITSVYSYNLKTKTTRLLGSKNIE